MLKLFSDKINKNGDNNANAPATTGETTAV